MLKSKSERIIATPSIYAREHLLYVQEAGSLQSIEPHTSKRKNLSSYLFFMVTKGEGTLSYAQNQHHIQSGDCIFIDCQEEYAHESSIDYPWELSWVHFYGHNLPALYKNYTEQGNQFLFHPANPTLFLDILNSLYQTQKDETLYKELTCHKYLTDLITYAFIQEKERTNSSFSSTHEKIRDICIHIDVHYSERITLDSLAEQFFISKYHLAREFKKGTGMTIGNYLTGKRISSAKKLLRFSSDSIDVICQKCGFTDAGYFIKAFKKAENMTPSQYRQKW